MADPPERFFNATISTRGSVHLWIKGNGHIIQMVPFDKSAWGNGQLNRTDGKNDPHPLIREWYQRGVNPNLETISIEICGVGRSGAFQAVTEAQWNAWTRIHAWLIDEQWFDSFGGENLLLHGMISATRCPDGRWTVLDLIAHLEDQMTKEEIEKIIDQRLALAFAVDNADDVRLAHFRRLLNLAVNGGDGAFADAQGKPLPLIRDADLVERVAALEAAKPEPRVRTIVASALINAGEEIGRAGGTE
jgi:hypothetical protein